MQTQFKGPPRLRITGPMGPKAIGMGGPWTCINEAIGGHALCKLLQRPPKGEHPWAYGPHGYKYGVPMEMLKLNK